MELIKLKFYALEHWYVMLRWQVQLQGLVTFLYTCILFIFQDFFFFIATSGIYSGYFTHISHVLHCSTYYRKLLVDKIWVI